MVKVKIVGLDKASQLCEEALKLRNPELWKVRQENHRKVRRAGGQPSLAGEYPELVGLTDLSREMSDARVKQYQSEMLANRWQFSTDPIVVSEDGDILNGQHRLKAASKVDWESGDEDDAIPEMIVLWGVVKETVLLMDEAQRSHKDRRDIALKYARRRA
jgi:hypothetical protein